MVLAFGSGDTRLAPQPLSFGFRLRLTSRRELDEARVASRRRDRENHLVAIGHRRLDRRRRRDVGHHGANLHELRVGISRRLQLDSRELPERNIISK